MRAFSAQVITVRGDITVEMSPAMKPERDRSAKTDHARERLAIVVALVVRAFGEHDVDFGVVLQVVELGDDVPAVELALVDLLGAVIEAAGVAEPDRVGGREQPEGRMRPDHPVLVEQRHPALDLEHALDHEHDVGPAGIVLVEHQRHRVLQRPGQHAFPVLGDLLAVAEHDRVLADQVDPGDVAVEIDAHARPVQVGRDLLDVGRLAGAVIALDHDPAVVGKAGEDRERGVAVEAIGVVDLGHVFGRLRERRHLQVGIDAEALSHRDLDVRRGRQVLQTDQPSGLGHRQVTLHRCCLQDRLEATA